MTFQEYLKTYMGADPSKLVKISKFKRENEELYAEYRARVKRVEEYYGRNRNNCVGAGVASEQLTEKNFDKYEKDLIAIDKLLNR